MLSYPSPDERGRMLAIWAGMRNSGSVIGGAINFANNYENSSAGVIRWSTYLIFIAFGTCALPQSKLASYSWQNVPGSSGLFFSPKPRKCDETMVFRYPCRRICPGSTSLSLYGNTSRTRGYGPFSVSGDRLTF
jgi:hypothetical protein